VYNIKDAVTENKVNFISSVVLEKLCGLSLLVLISLAVFKQKSQVSIGIKSSVKMYYTDLSINFIIENKFISLFLPPSMEKYICFTHKSFTQYYMMTNKIAPDL